MHRHSIILLVLIVSSCANYNLHHSNEVKDWNKNIEDNYPLDNPEYVLYGIGDSGYMPDGKTSPALTGIEEMMKKESAPSGIVFLGDNIYPAGMPKKSFENERRIAEDYMDAQLDILSGYKGDVFFIPGNHDWRQSDRQKGVERQEDYIQDKLGKKVYFPNNGCSGPHDFRLSEHVVLILIDSEWYTQNWDRQIDFNEKCDYKTRFDFMYELTDVIKKYAKDKRVIIGMHHPIFTNGVHGGKFALKDHILPLTNLQKPIAIPLPVIGSLYPILRKNAGIREDINGDKYKELRTEILKHTDAFGQYYFSGRS